MYGNRIEEDLKKLNSSFIYLHNIFLLVGKIVAYLSLSLIVASIVYLLSLLIFIDRDQKSLSTVAFDCSILLSFILFSFLFLTYEKRKWLSLGLVPGFKQIGLLFFGLIIGLLLSSVVIGYRIIVCGMELEWNPQWELNLFLLGTYSVFFMACVEELLFRGYPLLLLRYQFGLLPSMLISSMLFSLGHLGNFAIPNDDYGISFIYYFFCGIFFCSAFYWSNTLWFPIGIHFGGNLLILNFFSIEHIEWIQPLIVDSYIDETVATRSIQVEWLIRCCLYAVFSVFLVYRNKALYRTLRKYFHESS